MQEKQSLRTIKDFFFNHPIRTSIILLVIAFLSVVANKDTFKGSATFLGWVFLGDRNPVGWKFWNNAFPSVIIQSGDFISGTCEKSKDVDGRLEIEPYSAVVLLKCRCLLNQDKVDEAEQCYVDYLEIEKTSYETYHGLITAALKKGELEKARELKETGILEFEKMVEDYTPPQQYHFVDSTFRRALGTYAQAQYHLENLKQIAIE